MKSFPIPVVALGPGSQPDESPRACVASPGPMAVFRPPAPRPATNPAAIDAARQLLGRLLQRMESREYQRSSARQSLLEVDAGVVEQVNELLGHGEVSVVVTAPRYTRIQETAFPGIWRIQAHGEDGHLVADDLEAGPIPQAVRDALPQLGPHTVAAVDQPPGVMNAPSILVELIGVSADYRPGAEPHVVNLTLLPVSPEDLDYLATGLGDGPVTMLSRGYGNCRISSTALPHTWWVQYFNSTDQLILNTIEVTDVPVVGLAAPEDLDDSTRRLREWLRTL